MVVKINFIPTIIKQLRTTVINKKRHRILLYLLSVLSILFFLFAILCSIKIVLLYNDIQNTKTLLQEKETLLQKQSVNFSQKLDIQITFYNFLLKQLPSIELLSLLQDTVSVCNTISLYEISADCYNVSISGAFSDGVELNRFAELLGKSSLISSTSTPVVKNTGDETKIDFDIFIKLNSMRYALINDPLTKQESLK